MAQIDTWYRILNTLVSYGAIEDYRLKNLINISLPTLKKEVELINENLENILEIKKEQSYYELKIYNYSEFEYIMNGSLKKTTDFNSVKKRIAYILRELINDNTYILIDDLAEKLEISRGTVIRDLKEVKKITKKYNVEILGTPNRGLKISGEEFDIRLLYLHHIYDYFPLNNLKSKDTSYITSYSREKKLPTLSINTWEKVLEITLERINKNYQLTKPIPHYTNYHNNDKSFEMLVYKLESMFEVSFSQYDIDFLSFPLNISNSGAVDKVYMNEDFIRNIFDKMMQQVYEVTGTTFDNEKLYKEIRFHLMYLLNRMIFHIESYDYFYGELEKKYPFSYEIGKVALKKIEELVDRKASVAEISYLAVYFELMMKNKRALYKKIAIVCNTGKGTATIMKQQINQVLGENIIIETYTEKEYLKKDLSHYFAVFTTIPLKNVDPKLPLIRITNLFNDEWLHSEWQRINKINQLYYNHVDFTFSKIDQGLTYEQQLTKMINVLIEGKQVDEQFKSKIFEREKKQTTVFSNGIAFPHAINTCNESIVFHLGAISNETSIGTKNIKFIFMVGIPEKMSEEIEAELIQLYDNMLRITSDTKKSQELLNLNDSDDFYNYMWKEVLR